jgi:hypothetical protein
MTYPRSGILNKVETLRKRGCITRHYNIRFSKIEILPAKHGTIRIIELPAIAIFQGLLLTFW